MNIQDNNDLISRKEVLELIQPRLNSARVGSLEYQRLYSIQLSVKDLEAVSQAGLLQTFADLVKEKLHQTSALDFDDEKDEVVDAALQELLWQKETEFERE